MSAAPGFSPEVEELVLACAEGLQAFEVLRDLIACAFHEADDPAAVKRRLAEAMDALSEGMAALSLDAEAEA
ncbi:hypothetical protein [Teichococcus aerofrigidensis]